MKKIPEKDSENLPERVRRNTRPFVGVIDWYDNINTNPFSEPVQYFGSLEMDGYFRPGILWRYRNEGGLHYQEAWITRSKSWENTNYLLKMIIGGECSLADMTPEQAMRVSPEAFATWEKIDYVPR
jgi:hypothetical protein